MRTAVLLVSCTAAVAIAACGADTPTAKKQSGPTLLARAGATLMVVDTGSGKVRRVPAGAHDGEWRALYSARIDATAGTTQVTATDPASGRQLGSTVVPGRWIVPIAAGTTPEGAVSGDGRWLVLAGPSGEGTSHFALLRTTLDEPARRYRLRGRFDFDALAPDGSAIFLTQLERSGRYRVRAFDVRAKRLRPQVVVEKTAVGAIMQGVPVARAVDPTGAPVHTLYRGGPVGAFIHSLDTSQGTALCILLPRSRKAGARWRLRLSEDTTELHALNAHLGAHYVVDPYTGEVTDAPAGTELPGSRLARYALDDAGAVTAGTRRIAKLGEDAELLAVR